MSAQLCISNSKSHSLVISEYRQSDQLENIRACWSNLVANVPGLSVFVTPEWMFSWWRAYGKNKELCVLLFTDPQAGVVGIAPFYIERRKLLGFAELRVLRLMGDGSADSDDLNFIVKPGYAAAVADGVLDWLRQASWDVCEFNLLSSKSEVAALLEDELRGLGWKRIASHRPFTRVTLPDTWAEYLKRLTAKERRKVGIRLRRLQARSKVSFQRCEHPDDLRSSLDTLYALHQKRWEARGEPGSFSLPERLQFYEEMTQALLFRGWLGLWRMEIDGVPVAAQIGMSYGDGVYALQEGFDPAYASDSVGYVLRSHILQECVESGVRFYDFLYGDQDSKQRWGADVGHYIDFHFAKPASIGAIYLESVRVVESCKDWFRTHAPEKTWKRLQTLRRRMQGQRPNPEESVETAVSE
jgi:CelD/BcsL family acetyltransferase involved in cellulose biosynthesis